MAYHREPQKFSVQTTEVFALDLEREGKFSVAESLWPNISRIITKDLNKKNKSNLSFAERKAVTEMKHDKNISTYPFDKGTGLVVIKKEDAIQKIEEQIRKSKVIDNDPTPILLSKFQKELAKLRKENKFDNKIYLKLYPSDAIPPRLCRVIKAHKPEKNYPKPEKNYPMRAIVSTIETAPSGTSKYLVEIIQPTLNKNKHRVMNSLSFVNEAATWKTIQEEIQVSYDVINLYPSIP